MIIIANHRVCVTYLFLIFVGVDLVITQILHFLLAHEVVLHAALQEGYLEFLAAFGHELVLFEASIITNGKFFALVEVVQGEAALVGG